MWRAWSSTTCLSTGIEEKLIIFSAIFPNGSNINKVSRVSDLENVDSLISQRHYSHQIIVQENTHAMRQVNIIIAENPLIKYNSIFQSIWFRASNTQKIWLYKLYSVGNSKWSNRILNRPYKVKGYFFNWWDSLNCTSNSRCIVNLCSWSCKYTKLIFLRAQEEIFAYKLTTGSKSDAVQLGEKTLEFVGFRRKSMIKTIVFSARKWQPSGSVNNEILMIPAEGYKVVSIVTELTK